MAPLSHLLNPERLLTDAVASIAVVAYQRGIAISTHVDSRLPARIDVGSRSFGVTLRRGLTRTLDMGDAKGIALAMWFDDADEAGALLEICRAPNGLTGAPVAFANLWTGTLGEAAAPPVVQRRTDRTESVLIRLPGGTAGGPAATGPRQAGDAGRMSVLLARDILFDAGRCRTSLAAVGLDVTTARTAAATLAAARTGAEQGRPPECIVVDGRLLGADAAMLAGDIRADPRLVETRIVVVSDRKAPAPKDPTGRLFDSVLRLALPWRRLMDGLAGIAPRADVQGGARPIRGGGSGRVPQLAGRRILIAEDAATNQVLLHALLARTGAAVDSVEDGAAAVDRHRDSPADLILMDLQMPGMGGIAALERIRALGGRTASVPVVALTAHAKPADRQKALDAGMDAYLAKPIIVAEFYDLIARLLPAAASDER